MAGDRNFDDLAYRFASNVYQTLKGRIRLDVIQRDLEQRCPQLQQPGGVILDAGCGRAPFAGPLLSLGHKVTLVDVSVEMLKLALAEVEPTALAEQKLAWFHGTIVQYQRQAWSGQSFDVILCHAVLEWVEDPQALLHSIHTMLKPGGVLSLLFYNLDGLIFKNLLRTNFKKVNQGQYRGGKRSLTPTYPRKIDDVKTWCQALNLEPVCHSGIRVFHDFVLNEEDRNRQPEELKALELQFSSQSPYRELGRYQHMLWQKPK